MKRFRCGDVVPGCARVFTGSEDDVYQAAAAHARADHGVTEISPALEAHVRSKILDV